MTDMNKRKISNIINNSVAFCFACLSTDRHLYLLGNYAEVFSNICEFPDTRLSKISLCWECISVLRKVKLFKAKVEEAQSILKFHLVKKQHSLPCSLTNLTIVSPDIIDITDIAIDVTKEEIETKTEICCSEDDNPDYVDDDFTSNDIKIENDAIDNVKVNDILENKKTVNKRKSLHYKYVFKDGTIQGSSFNRRIPIDNQDLKVLLDNERESDFYKNYKYKCKKCIHAWSKKNKLDEHNRKYHNLSHSHICMICSRRYPDKVSLSTHTSTHDYVHECSICLYRSHSGLIMDNHLKTHKKAVQCMLCSFYFQFHYETNECTICNKRYKSLWSLHKHSYVNHMVVRGEDAYCAPCNKQFSNVFVYRRHVRTSTAHAKERDGANKKFPCPTCGKVYSRKSYMMNHFRHVHERRSKYYCTHCHKYFLNRTRYTDHMKYNHEGLTKEKNKLCNICGRGFSTNRTLEHHLRTHWGSRPHKCPHPTCGAAFTQRHAMHLHYNKHKNNTKKQH